MTDSLSDIELCQQWLIAATKDGASFKERLEEVAYINLYLTEGLVVLNDLKITDTFWNRFCQKVLGEEQRERLGHHNSVRHNYLLFLKRDYNRAIDPDLNAYTRYKHFLALEERLERANLNAALIEPISLEEITDPKEYEQNFRQTCMEAARDHMNFGRLRSATETLQRIDLDLLEMRGPLINLSLN